MELVRDARKPRKWSGENDVFVNISRSIYEKLQGFIRLSAQFLENRVYWSDDRTKKHNNLQANSEEQDALDCNDRSKASKFTSEQRRQVGLDE